MPKLKIVVASTRPGRVGPSIATWINDFAAEHAGFEVEVLDLAEINLPLIDEPGHPRSKQYQHNHTKAWSAKVEDGDAFIFVTPEYNFGSPPALINALDYLFSEWAYKPVAFVSYGGVSGGLRSVQMTKQIVTTLSMMPIVESVTIPFFAKSISDEGAFVANELQLQSAKVMLDELLRWSNALQVLRVKA